MENMYPTEVITLPSYGKYYAADHPLRQNGGKLEIKFLTAKEEDILTSTNLMRSGQTMDKLLESIVVHKGVDYRDLTANDISAILLSSRILSYGKDYDVEMRCDQCKQTVNNTIDLSQLEMPDEDQLIEPNPDGTYTFTVPSGKSITIRVLTRKDEIEVDQQIESASKKGLNLKLFTTRLKKIVIDIDGERDKSTLSTMIENLIVVDTREIRKQYDKITPVVDNYIEVTCSNCGSITGGELPITAKFFWPDL